MLAAAVLAVPVPVASQHRTLNRLTQTRESATTWRFFESLHEKRILIVTDRPNLYTIMDYGAMSFEAARNDPFIFEALARRLFYDIYVVQQIKLSTNRAAARLRHLARAEARDDAGVPERRGRAGSHLTRWALKRHGWSRAVTLPSTRRVGAAPHRLP